MLFTRLLQRTPSLCAVCRSWGAQVLCAACLRRFAAPVPRCARCALQVPLGVGQCGRCITHPPIFDRAYAAVDYAHPWSSLIAQFKFREALDLTHALASLLAATQQHRDEPAPTLLLPVPLATRRLRERGYNQSWELARRVTSALGIESDARLLVRTKDSPHQLALPPEQRAANVRGAFAVTPARAHELRGRSVAVIDDVMTTGATFAEIAQVLKQAGAAQVEAWALARTPRTSG